MPRPWWNWPKNINILRRNTAGLVCGIYVNRRRRWALGVQPLRHDDEAIGALPALPCFPSPCSAPASSGTWGLAGGAVHVKVLDRASGAALGIWPDGATAPARSADADAALPA